MGGRSSVSGLRVTVFGATGFVGRYLVNKLGQIGSQVIVPYRGNESDTMHLKPMGDYGQIVMQPFHLRDYASILSAVRHSDAVVNLIAQDRETRNFAAHDVHVAGPLAIAQACAEASVQRFIHVSTALASSTSASVILRSRAEGEQALRTHFPDTVIVRPTALFGHEDRFIHAIGSFASFLTGYPVVNHGRAHRFPLYVGDLANGLARLVRLSAIQGSTFDLFGLREMTIAQVIETFCYLACRPFRLLNLPPWLFNLYARLYPEWRRFLFTRDLIKQLAEDELRLPGARSWVDIGMDPAELKTLEHDGLSFIRTFRHLDDFSKILPPLKTTSAAMPILK